MNKLKLLGVSALCGSLAAVSAQAGEMSVSGGANATYTTKAGAVTGQPLGMATNLTFQVQVNLIMVIHLLLTFTTTTKTVIQLQTFQLIWLVLVKYLLTKVAEQVLTV
jgi:hypothetical protein